MSGIWRTLLVPGILNVDVDDYREKHADVIIVNRVVDIA